MLGRRRRRRANIGPTSGGYHRQFRPPLETRCILGASSISTNTWRLPNAVVMVGQCRRQIPQELWNNVSSLLGDYIICFIISIFVSRLSAITSGKLCRRGGGGGLVYWLRQMPVTPMLSGSSPALVCSFKGTTCFFSTNTQSFSMWASVTECMVAC